MGIRFRKSIKLLPGLYINLGKKGVSLSIGKRGIRTTLNSKGRLTKTISIPGTGISFSKSLDMGKRPKIRNSGISETILSPSQQVEYSFKELLSKVNEQFLIPIDWNNLEKLNACFCYTDSDIAFFHLKRNEVINAIQSAFIEIINHVNPFDDFEKYWKITKIAPMAKGVMSIRFSINFIPPIDQSNRRNDVNVKERDYICSCSIRIAKDIFSLLPLQQLLVSCFCEKDCLLSVEFNRTVINQDPILLSVVDIIHQYRFRLFFTEESGFLGVRPLDENK